MGAARLPALSEQTVSHRLWRGRGATLVPVDVDWSYLFHLLAIVEHLDPCASAALLPLFVCIGCAQRRRWESKFTVRCRLRHEQVDHGFDGVVVAADNKLARLWRP